ncbi:hypothetical protein B0H14DRAFT_2872338 [Mycena olivaceomarginata]|nr:hypothetical protein B0H14DRAFT_2872338 [Mycena olivaceomarginata]
MPIGEDKRCGVSGGVTAVTSTVGNGVGGLLGTVGDVTGAAGRGCAGGHRHRVTGSYGKPAGDALHSLGDGVAGGTNKIARGVEDAGKGKKGW